MYIKSNTSNYVKNNIKEVYKNYLQSNIFLCKKGNKLIPKNNSGDKIHIKDKNKGKFTQSAKEADESVQEHANSVLSNSQSTVLQKKRAIFAKNAKNWNHDR